MLDEILKTSEAFNHIMKYSRRPDLDERTKFMRTVTIFIAFLGGVVYLIHLTVGMLLGTLRVFSMPLFLVRVGAKKEVVVARRLYALRNGEGVYAIYVPPRATIVLYDRKARTDGYIIVEAEDEGKVAKLMSLLDIRRRIIGEISEEELSEYIRPRLALKKGMKVRIISGPFNGYEAIIEDINESKNTVFVRILEDVLSSTLGRVEVPANYVVPLKEKKRSHPAFFRPVLRYRNLLPLTF